MGDKPERFLWNPTEFSSITKQRQTETFESIRSRFESAPSTRSLWLLIANSHVVVQEIAITAYLLARHRLLIAAPPLSNSLQSALHAWSTFFIMSALGVVLGVGSQLQSSQDRKAKFRQRSADGILMATLLRFMASLLRSLTASYASDSLYTLAVGFLVVHVLSCDYLYANGDTDSYPKHADVNASDRLLFQGGTVSFNSALFSTTLLASRLAISDAYVFIYFSIVLFAFYPVTRNSIAAAYPAISSGKSEVRSI